MLHIDLQTNNWVYSGGWRSGGGGSNYGNCGMCIYWADMLSWKSWNVFENHLNKSRTDIVRDNNSPCL